MRSRDDICRAALSRIAARYQRRNRPDLWNEVTVKEFLRVFALVQECEIMSIVDEMLLAPPTDDRGRALNFLPDPEDFVAIYMRRKKDALQSYTPAQVVAEIVDAINRYGEFGVVDPVRPAIRHLGEPPLSEAARDVVKSFGGWIRLCTEEQSYSVLISNLLRVAEQYKNKQLSAAEQTILKALRPAQSPPIEDASVRLRADIEGASRRLRADSEKEEEAE